MMVAVGDGSLGPVTLAGRHIRLEPLRPEHAAGLLAAARPEVWAHTSAILDTPEAIDHYIAAALTTQEQGREYPFAVVEAENGRILGSTRYLDVNHQHRAAEIGWTWYTPEVWGTAVNPEAKLLLLRHAFEDWGAIRMCLLTDVRNLHSQAAIRKLGAKYEGTLRNHRIRRDGSYRDSVLFSITRDEWPAVEIGLRTRLNLI